MVIWQYRGSILVVWIIVQTILSWRHGAAPERATAVVLLASAVTTWLYRKLALPQQNRTIGGFEDTDLVYVVTDLITFAFLFAIMLAAAHRRYPVWMAGMQLIAMGMHLVNEIERERAPFAYGLLNMGPFYFMVLAQALGLVFHSLREKRWGPYPSWRKSYDPSRMMKRT